MEKALHTLPLLTAGQSAAPARAVAIALLIFVTGCMPGPTFRMVQSQLRPIDPKQVSYADGANLSTRDWVRAVDDDLHDLLPKNAEPVLTADKLVRADGTPKDIYRTFGLNPDKLDSLFGNFSGVSYTAKVVMRNDPPKKKEWPGYRRVQVPMDDGAKLYGRLGTPIGKDTGTYVIILHGMFGKQGGSDQYNLAQALRTFGHHVLLLDLRGHGETVRHEPDDPFTFGLDEPVDLLATSRWLRSEQHAKRIGLVGFSITAHHALLAAWVDGDPTLAGSPHSPILQALRRPDVRPQFDAGIIAISPVLNLCEYADSLNRRHGVFGSPVRAVFQGQVERRIKEMGGGGYRMWDYMKHELKRSRWSKQFPTFEMLFSEEMRFANLCATPQSGARRMDQVRVPVLVLHAVNDPVGGSAQAVANIFGQTRNRNCGVIMTRDGGHTGMSALAPVYYYSLIRAFFDPATAPQTVGSAATDLAADHPDQIRMEPITEAGR